MEAGGSKLPILKLKRKAAEVNPRVIAIS